MNVSKMELIVCYYCGAIADTKDHFVPTSFVTMIEDFATVKQIIVDCCRECNSTAGDRIFYSLSEKRLYIRDAYLKKYKHLLETPKWKQSELDELGYALRCKIENLEEEKRYIKLRLKRLSRGTKLPVTKKPKKDKLDPRVREALENMLKVAKSKQRLF